MGAGRGIAYQQAVGAVDGDAAGERVVDGQAPDVRGWVVASLLIHISRQVEVDWVLTHQLLPHVLQLHALQVCRLEPQRKLGEESRGQQVCAVLPEPPHWCPHPENDFPQDVSLISTQVLSESKTLSANGLRCLAPLDPRRTRCY